MVQIYLFKVIGRTLKTMEEILAKFFKNGGKILVEKVSLHFKKANTSRKNFQIYSEKYTFLRVM